MASRGTMGLRITRLLVDGLLNNTTYCRAFPSDTQRCINLLEVIVNWNVMAVTTAVPPVPAAYLYSSMFRVKWEVKCSMPAFTIDSEVYINGVATGYTFGYTGDSWQNVTRDIPGLKGGDLVTIWSKVRVGQTGTVRNLSMNCANEGVIEAIGSAGAW